MDIITMRLGGQEVDEAMKMELLREYHICSCLQKLYQDLENVAQYQIQALVHSKYIFRSKYCTQTAEVYSRFLQRVCQFNKCIVFISLLFVI